METDRVSNRHDKAKGKIIEVCAVGFCLLILAGMIYAAVTQRINTNPMPPKPAWEKTINTEQ